MNDVNIHRGARLPVVTAVAGTVLIAAGAFWLSFTALADLARRSGIDARQAWAWPLIVDGIIVVATVAVVALAGTRTAWYPWMLLMTGAGLSVTANGVHAIVAADADVPSMLAASVAAVPPLVLLAITHLTVILTRHRPSSTVPDSDLAEEPAEPRPVPPPIPASAIAPTFQFPVLAPARDLEDGAPELLEKDSVPAREVAEALRTEGWSNKRIARHLGVHPSTVGRWWRANAGDAAPADLDTHEHDDEEGA